MPSASTSSSTTEEIPAGRPQRAPTHPGELVAEVVATIGLPVAAAARQLRVTRQTLHRIIAGQAAVTPEMALRLGRWCGNGPGLWLRMQGAHDLWHAERQLDEELAQIPSHAGAPAKAPPARARRPRPSQSARRTAA
jgi:addiction module HigA family antidote